MEEEKRQEVIVICDSEEDYLDRMVDFINSHSKIPWKVRAYTDVSHLEKGIDKDIHMAVVSEDLWEAATEKLNIHKAVKLGESEGLNEGVYCVNKYQEAESVLKFLIEVYMELGGGGFYRTSDDGRTKFLGIYTPVRRCLQTTFALTAAEILGEKNRVLYLNFECYAGEQLLLAGEGEKDLSDLIYYLKVDPQRFYLRFQSVVKKVGNIDLVPAMRTGPNLLLTEKEEWMKLMANIDGMGEYDYVVMDLSESMQGLFDILRQCCAVYTITRSEHMADLKVMQYEHVLEMYEYQDVINKTQKCELPVVKNIPEEIQFYSRGDLADYTRKCLEPVI